MLEEYALDGLILHLKQPFDDVLLVARDVDLPRARQLFFRLLCECFLVRSDQSQDEGFVFFEDVIEHLVAVEYDAPLIFGSLYIHTSVDDVVVCDVLGTISFGTPRPARVNPDLHAHVHRCWGKKTCQRGASTYILKDLSVFDCRASTGIIRARFLVHLAGRRFHFLAQTMALLFVVVPLEIV